MQILQMHYVFMYINKCIYVRCLHNMKLQAFILLCNPVLYNDKWITMSLVLAANEPHISITY